MYDILLFLTLSVYKNICIIPDMSISSVALVNGQKNSCLGVKFRENVAENATSSYQKSFEGVSPNCAHTSSAESKWYLMRAAYGQEKKAEEKERKKLEKQLKKRMFRNGTRSVPLVERRREYS